MELDTDSITTETERATQPPKAENAPMVWASTNDWGENEWRGDLNLQGWLTNGWGESIPQTQHNGSFANTGKGGEASTGGGNLKTDPGCKAYEDSEWALKTNGRAIVKNMHLLRGCANYGDWGNEAIRRSRMLYSRPVSLGMDYFVSNLKGREGAEIDVDACGFLKHKPRSGIEENEKSILRG